MKALITGGAGFVGHHIFEGIMKNTDWEIILLDRLDFSGNLNRLTSIDRWEEFKCRTKFIYHDLKAKINHQLATQIGEVDYIFHLAAGSHVDRSIENPLEFIQDNVVGTCNLLEWYRRYNKRAKFNYFSTDEVFGPAPQDKLYKEWDRYNSTNPYAASKAGAEELCLAYANCYDLHIFITHSMNIIGERQHPEKLLPWCIKKILNNELLVLHGAKETATPTRFFIHPRVVCDALLFLIQKSEKREKYNIVGERELQSLDIVNYVSNCLNKEFNYEIRNAHENRPGHDTRYSLDGTKLKEMGWFHPKTIFESLNKTIDWYVKHPEWL